MHPNTRSRAVAWLPVYDYVRQRIRDAFPTAGTPAWCELTDDNPVKLAAVLDAGQHWTLHIETRQEAFAEASKNVAAAIDWRAVANELNSIQQFRKANPWAIRVTS